MRLIDADAIKIKPVYMHDICGVVMIRVEDIARILNDMPTISPEPERKTGKWILIDNYDGWPDWKCSQCGGSGRGDYPYCPWCNADMRGEQND